MKMRWIFFAIVVTVLAILALHGNQGTRKDMMDMGYRELTAQWQSIFLNRDAATASALVLRAGAAMPTEESHTISHIIGAVLYDRYGLDGLQYRTDDFNFGCYHGFAGRVIEEQGPLAIGQLMSACDAFRPLNCQHGVGHGLLAYMGNDHLNDALSYCPTARPGPCTTGIFMEYFLNTMTRSEDRRILPFDPRHPTDPCSVITEERYVGACYYNLPKLWRYYISQTTEDTFERLGRIGEYCERVPDPALRASCFAGAGALAAPLAKFDEKVTMELCDIMPRDGTEACKTEARHSLEQNK